MALNTVKYRVRIHKGARLRRQSAAVFLLVSFTLSPSITFAQSTDLGSDAQSSSPSGETTGPASDQSTSQSGAADETEPIQTPSDTPSLPSTDNGTDDGTGDSSDGSADTSEAGDASETAQDDSSPPMTAMSTMAGGESSTEAGTIFINTEATHSAAPKVDTQTGALSYSYAIAVPPGRSGATPALSLDYNSNTTDNSDEFGYGWSVSIPYIDRTDKYGSDQLYSTDNFYSSLDGELIRVGSTTSFVPRTENGAFRKYTFDNNVWTVAERDGTVLTFGSTTAARRDDPSNSSHIYGWELESSIDANANSIAYSYFKDAGQIYPSGITYSNFGSTTGPFSIEFDTETRSDNLVSNTTGFTSTTTYRINEIQAKVNGSWVYKYDLSYAAGHNGKRSLLSSVTESAKAEDDAVTTLPATNFTYETVSSGDKDWSNDSDWTVPVNIARSSQGYDDGARFVDINGDGLPDIIQEGSTDLYNTPPSVGQAVYLNTGEGWATSTDWTLPHGDGRFGFVVGNLPIDGYGWVSNVDTGARFADVNKDGYTDILWGYQASHVAIPTGSFSYSFGEVYLNNQHGGWATSTDWTLPSGFLFADEAVDNGGRIADVNGDGLPDLLISNSTQNSVYLNTGDGWALASTSWNIPEPFADTEVNFSGPDRGTRLADVNGDGLVDIVRSLGSEDTDHVPAVHKVYLNTGNGWRLDTSWSTPLDFAYYGVSYGWVGESTRLVDVNNDGLPDLIASSYNPSDNTDTNAVYINTGKGWVHDTSWGSLPPFKFGYTGGSGYQYTEGGIAEMDVDGDNAIDFVQSGPDSRTYSQTQSVNLSNGKPVDLLSSIEYPEGGEMTVEYKQSALYTDGSGNHLNPNLSSNLNTVGSVTFDDAVTDPYTHTYSYGGGENYFASSTDTEFAGFATTTATDARGNTTTTYIHQGNDSQTDLGEYQDSYQKIGKPYLTETRDPDGHLFQRILDKWDSFAIATGSAFVFNAQEITQDYDGDSDHKDSATEYDYSPLGDLTSVVQWGEVTASSTDGSFADTGSDKRVTDYEYASSTSPYIVLPSQTTVENQAGDTVKETKLYYDDSAYGGVSAGNLTEEDDWITGSTYAATKRVYNPFGLVTELIDPRSATTTYTYDAYNLYPASTTNALSQASSATYDYGVGKIDASTDPNGHTTQWTYDGLGRILSERIPDPVTGSLVDGLINDYTDDRGDFAVETTRYLSASSSVPSYQYLDGFNRVIQDRDTAADDNTYVVKDSIYGEDGLLDKESLPYFGHGASRHTATTTDELFTSYTYDPLDRKTSVENAEGITEISYDQWSQAVTDPLEHLKEYAFDAYDDLLSVAEHNATSTYTTNYEWDPLGDLTKVTDALGNVRNFAYDGLGHRISAQDLHAPADATFGTWDYEYDLAGNSLRTTDPNGQVIDYAYDLLNRVTSEDYEDTAGNDVAYTYDGCINGVGLLCSASSTEALSAYTYTPNSLVATETKTVDGTPYETQYAYDRAGNRTDIVYPDDSAVKYGFNDAGQVNSVQQKESGGFYGDIATNIEYAPNGSVSYEEDGNGTYTENTYDPLNLYRLTRKTVNNLTRDDSEGMEDMLFLPDTRTYSYSDYFKPDGSPKGQLSLVTTNNTVLASSSQSAGSISSSTVPDRTSLKSTPPVLGAEVSEAVSGNVLVRGYKTSTNLDSLPAAAKTVQQAQKEGLTLGTEIRSKRSANTRVFSTNKDGIYVAEIHSGKPAYYEDANSAWWLIEYATSTLSSSKKQQPAITESNISLDSPSTPEEQSLISKSFYTDPNPEATSVDGYVEGWSDSNWTRLHSKATGTPHDSDDTFWVRTSIDYYGEFIIDRAILVFDTSSIPDNAVISAADLNLYVNDLTADNSEHKVYVTSVSVASTTSITNSDYGHTGSTSFGDSGESYSAGSYLDIPLNSSGVSVVSATGTTALALRTYGDFNNVKPTGSSELSVQFFASEYASASEGPILVVVYNTAPNAAVALETENHEDPSSLTDATPFFTAAYVDPDDGDTASAYQIQVSTSPGDWSSPVWDSDKAALSTEIDNGHRSPRIEYAGPELTPDETYYWRMKFWDAGDSVGAWSTTTASFSITGSTSPLMDNEYTYDADGNIVSITDNRDPNISYVDSYTYDDLNRMTMHTHSSEASYGASPYEIPIVLSAASSTLTDFPTYFDLSSLPTNFWSHLGSSDGGDIRVKDTSYNELPMQLIDINALAHTGHLFFKAPVIDSATSTTYYITYGNTHVTSEPANSLDGSEAVWSNYAAVYHLDEDPTLSQMLDSAAGGQSLGTSGSFTASSSIAGKLDNAVNLNGTDDLLAHSSAVNLTALPALTVSAWVKPDVSDSPYVSYGRYDLDLGGYDWAYLASLNPTADFSIYKDSGSGSGDRMDGFGSTPVATSTWSYLATTWDGDGHIQVYLNGVLDGTATDTAITSMTSNNFNTLYVGGSIDIPFGNGYFNGALDEVRISAATTSAAQVAAEYKNVISPSSFYSVGSEQDLSIPNDVATSTYSYDALGNLLSVSDGGTYTYSGTGYANPDAVTGIGSTTLAYDNNGNLTSEGSASYEWDYKNRMTSASVGSTTATYGYDENGSRISKEIGGVTTAYPNQYFDQTGTSTEKRIYLGDDLVATISGTGSTTATTTYSHADHLGSTRLVTDGAGEVIQSIDYSPYGAVSQNTASTSFSESRQYIGQLYDPESSLSYLNARYYDGGRGQFLSEDPIFLGDPKQQDLTNPQSLNSYSYGNDNPITNSDPSGRCIWDGCGLETGAALAYGEYLTAVAPLIAEDYASLKENASQGSIGGTAFAALGLAADFVPGGAIAKDAEVSAKAAQMMQNAGRGAAFEKAIESIVSEKKAVTASQVTVKAPDGTKVRLDFASKDAQGCIFLCEAKSSETAPLTKNQKAAFPQIQKNGGTVVGAGKPGFPGGMMIPPTTVQIIRPSDVLPAGTFKFP